MGILDYLSRNSDMIANSMGGVGEALSALDQGRAANMAPYQQRTAQLMERKRMQGLKPGILGHMQGMTPQQRQLMDGMYDADPRAAMGIMAQQAFPNPSDPYERYKVVPGAGLADLAAPNGPVIVQGTRPDPKLYNVGGNLVTGGGESVFSAPKDPKERRIIKGADGQNYYADTGDAVLGGVDAKPEERKIVNVGGVPYYADTQAPVIEGLTADQAASFKDEQSMRKEWNALTKDFRAVRDAYTKVIGSAENASAAGDMALIFNYMKMLDPGSVVREGEFATAQNATGVPERIRNTYNSIKNGERLNPAQRQDFMATAGQVFEGQNELYERDLGKYRDIAREYGFNPEAAVPSLPIIRQPSAGGGQLMIDPQTGQKWLEMPDGSFKRAD